MQQASEEKEETQVKDELGLEEKFKNLLFSKAIQNAEIRGDLYFIRNEELEDLPKLLVNIVDEKLGD